MAVRRIDGNLEINFTHKRHMWEPAFLQFADAREAFWRESGKWMINVCGLEAVFQILPTQGMQVHIDKDECGSATPVTGKRWAHHSNSLALPARNRWTAQGTCVVEVCAAMTGEFLCNLRAHPSSPVSFLHKVRVAVAPLLTCLYFNIHAFHGTQSLEEQQSWAQLGCPARISVVVTPELVEYEKTLLEAIDADNLSAVCQCLRTGQTPNAVPGLCRGALHWAAMTGKAQMAHLLLSFSARLDAFDDMGTLPLHAAAKLIDPATFHVLLQHGADPLLKDRRGDTAFSVAVARNQNQTLAFCTLVQKRAPTF